MGEVDRRNPITLRNDYPEQMLTMSCGCEYRANHVVGDRVFHCPHRDWIIRVAEPPKIVYLVEPVPLPKKPEDAPKGGDVLNKELFG
jgi:hypothetical protein